MVVHKNKKQNINNIPFPNPIDKEIPKDQNQIQDSYTINQLKEIHDIHEQHINNYKKGNIWAYEEREFCGRVTKSKYNGFNPKFSEKKKYEDIREQLEDYENSKTKKWVLQRIDYKNDSEDLSIEEFYSEDNMIITDEMIFDHYDYETADAYYTMFKPFGDYRLIEKEIEL